MRVQKFTKSESGREKVKVKTKGEKTKSFRAGGAERGHTPG